MHGAAKVSHGSGAATAQRPWPRAITSRHLALVYMPACGTSAAPGLVCLHVFGARWSMLSQHACMSSCGLGSVERDEGGDISKPHKCVKRSISWFSSYHICATTLNNKHMIGVAITQEVPTKQLGSSTLLLLLFDGMML